MARFVLLDTENLKHVAVAVCGWCDALVPADLLDSHRAAAHPDGTAIVCSECCALVPRARWQEHKQLVHPIAPPAPVLPIGGAS